MRSNAVDKLGVPCAPGDYAAASLVGADQPATTVEMGARVNVVEAVVAVALVALFPGTLSTRCSSIATTVHVRGKAFTPMMLSFQLARLFPTSPITEILPLKKGRLLLSWVKLPTKPLVDGQLHQTVHTLGDTAF